MEELYFKNAQECYDAIDNLQVENRDEVDVYKDLLIILKRSTKIERDVWFREGLKDKLREKGLAPVDANMEDRKILELISLKGDVSYPKEIVAQLFKVKEIKLIMELIDSPYWTDVWLETQEPGITQPFKDYKKSKEADERCM